MEFRRAIPEDFSDILRIQTDNFIGNLSAEERREGFVSAQFTRRQIGDIAGSIALLVASDAGRVLGYLCASSCEFNRQFPLLDAMIGAFDHVAYHGKNLSSYNAFVYGPVCIDRSSRGRGLLRPLYELLLREVRGRYEVGVAFVSKDNPRSLIAHVNGLGMARVGEFEFGGRRYDILSFRVDTEER